MQVFSFSACIGGTKCNAACPGCVARMTGASRPAKNPCYRNLKKACQMATTAGALTILFTGKGEPTLYPDLITRCLKELERIAPYIGKASFFRTPRWFTSGLNLIMGGRIPEYDRLPFPFADLQTNGIELINMEKKLRQWHRMGLSLVCLSISHWNDAKNKELMRASELLDIWGTVQYLHSINYSVRINVTAQEDGIENMNDVEEVVELCRTYDVEQLTIRDLTTPSDEETTNKKVTKWVKDHQVGLDQVLRDYLIKNGAIPILPLSHGAMIYSYKGQNIAANNCLTPARAPEELRQVIWHEDGTIAHDWVNDAARLL